MMIEQLKPLLKHLSRRRRIDLVALVGLIIVASIAEAVSLVAILPFLSIITAPERINEYEILRSAADQLSITTSAGILLFITLGFSIAILLSGGVRVLLILAQARLSSSIGVDFSIQVYERTLYQPYTTHVTRNSSEILAGCQKARDLVSSIIQPTLVLFSSVFMLLAVLATLLTINFFATMVACLSFGLIYFVVIKSASRKLDANSSVCALHQIKVSKIISEGLGGIRDVLIDGTQSFYVKLYQDAMVPMQRSSASNQVIGQSPRYVIESLGMILIALFAYSLAISSGNEVVDNIPLLGALALGAQRILPILQAIYSSLATIKGAGASIQDAITLLDQVMPKKSVTQGAKIITFNEKILLSNVTYRYPNSQIEIINRVNLEIIKGSRVGFVGPTGSGKTTLLDIIMGLLPSAYGEILIDGVKIDEDNVKFWRERISHVPQNIFLSDGSVAENIAFGVAESKIDYQRVKWAADQARISETIENWVDKYDTKVGERGVRLSGGQRQRIGIARALYKRSELIIFDEATSALDNETEAEVMKSISTLGTDVTILIIAHRLTTLRECDKIVEIKNGRVCFEGSFEQLRKS
jgi:ABC-type multidrug transport system fused ATPase/permease subunit